jgi:pimeloyl-ACP methyl ester carboxylesterase
MFSIFFCRQHDLPVIQKTFPQSDLQYISNGDVNFNQTHRVLMTHFNFAAGHWVHAEKPAEFLQLVLGFLNK